MSDLVSPIFVGRQPELEVLRDAWRRVKAGESVGVLISADAGLGKTRLVAEFLAELRDEGPRQLIAYSREIRRGGTPFTPLFDIVETLSSQMPASELRDLLGPALPVLASFIPDLMTLEPGPIPEDTDPTWLIEQLLALLRRVIAPGPSVLVFEDVHWADAPTLELLSRLLSQPDPVKPLVLLTSRPDPGAEWPFSSYGPRWVQQRLAEQLQLRRLRSAEVAAQVAAIAGDTPPPELVDLITERSGGNPVFVEELLAASDGNPLDAERLAATVSGAFLTRVQQLSDDARLVVRLISVAVRPMSEEALSFVTGLGPEALSAALEEAISAQVLVADPGYRFRHALANDATRSDLSAGERARLHRAHAEGLERRRHMRLTDLDTSTMLAHHRLGAGDLPEALVATINAGRAAMIAGTPAAALQHLELALGLWDQVKSPVDLTAIEHVDLLAEAADTAGWAGASARGLELIDRAFSELQSDVSVSRIAPLVVRRTELLRDVGREEESLVALKALVDRLPDEATATNAYVLAHYCSAMAHLDRRDGLDEWARRAVAVAAKAGAVRELLIARQLLATAMMEDAEFEPALELMQRTAEQARKLGHAAIAVRASIRLADMHLQRCEHEQALSVADEGVTHADQLGLGNTYGAVQRLNAGDALMRLGRWSEALSRLDPGDCAPGVFAGGLLMQRAELRLFMGDVDLARDDLTEARQHLRAAASAQFSLTVARVEAEIAAASGEERRAGAIIEQTLSDANPEIGQRYRWPLVCLGIRLEADRLVAARLAKRPVEGTGLWLATLIGEVERLPVKSPSDDGYHALCVAEYARAEGVDNGEWASAVVSIRELRNVYRLAYTLFRSAEALKHAGLPAAAIAAAGESRKLSSGLGAKLLLADIERLGVL